MDRKSDKKKSNDSDDLAFRRSSRRRGPPKTLLDEDFVGPWKAQKALGNNKGKNNEFSTETKPPSLAPISDTPVVVGLEMTRASEVVDPIGEVQAPVSMGDAAGDGHAIGKLPSSPIVSTEATTSSELKRKWESCKSIDYPFHSNDKRGQFRTNSCADLFASSSMAMSKKLVWIWTENKQVMTAAVERGWNTFVFDSHHRDLADEWSSMALIYPLFIEKGELLDSDHRRVATFSEISSPEQLERLQPEDEQAENVIVNLLDWQVIPAENIVAAFQGSQKTVLAISKTPGEAQTFLEALELGLGGVVLKVEDVKGVLELKDYIDRRNESSNILDLTKATVTQVQMAGMGDRVCVDLCSLLRPGEGLLVGSFARGLFLVHSECLESNYISSRPFRVNAGPVHAYVAVPGGKTCYLSELKAGKEVIVVDQNGRQRTAIVGRVKIETRPLVLVEAKFPKSIRKEVIVVDQNGRQRTAIVGRVKIETRPLVLVEAKADSDNHTPYSILLQNAETVPLVCSQQGNGHQSAAIPVTSLKVGDEVFLRIQGGARHTGIEIQEFIVEK